MGKNTTETIQGHKKTAGTAPELLRNSNLEPSDEQESLMKAYTNLTSASYLMLFVQSYVDRRVEIEDVNGKINPIIIHPRAQVHFGIALSDNSSLILKGTVLGTSETVFLNQYPKVRIQPENDIYKQAHIVIAASSDKQNSKQSPYATDKGGDSRLNMTSEIQKNLEKIGSKEKESKGKEISMTMTFRNSLGVVIEVNEITGAIQPIKLRPFELKTMRLTVKKTWPLIFHANSGNQFEEILLNGQRQLRVYLPADAENIKEVTITARNTAVQTEQEQMHAVMLSINNTLKRPVVLFDIANLMKPLVVPEHRLCQVGFFVKSTGYVLLSGITLGEKTSGVSLNGEVTMLVTATQSPSDQTLITIANSFKNTTGGNDTKNGNDTSSGSEVSSGDSANTQSHKEPNSLQPVSADGVERFIMLSIHNTLDNAVKFVELTGARKPFIVPAHADTKLGFSIVRSGPIVLRAIDVDTNKACLINGQNSLRVEASEDPNKITEVVLSKKESKGNGEKEKKINKRLIYPSLPRLILMHR